MVGKSVESRVEMWVAVMAASLVVMKVDKMVEKLAYNSAGLMVGKLAAWRVE